MLVVRFSNQSTKDFIFKNRKKLHATGKAQWFLSPDLSLEDSRNQQTIIKNFKSFWNGDQFNLSIFAQEQLHQNLFTRRVFTLLGYIMV